MPRKKFNLSTFSATQSHSKADSNSGKSGAQGNQAHGAGSQKHPWLCELWDLQVSGFNYKIMEDNGHITKNSRASK